MALLELHRVSKAFPGTQALYQVDLDVDRGEVHALVGENGAGKSTLIKLLSGVFERDSGIILLDGEVVSFGSPQAAQRGGIRTLHQESSLFPELTVAENISLGSEPQRRWLPVIDRREMRRQAGELLRMLEVDIEPDTRAGELDLSEQQMVEIAKMLHRQARLLILDEPTAPLSAREVTSLHRLIRALKKQGVGILYISHRLEEIFDIADRVTVLRDGRRLATLDIQDCTAEQLARMMAGRANPASFHRSASRSSKADPRPEVLRVQRFSLHPAFEGISFTLRAGEIFGLTGPIGSGCEALVRALFGFGPQASGSVYVDGRRVHIRSPQEAIDLGIGFLPAERHDMALLPNLPAQANISIAALANAAQPIINAQEESELAERYIQRLRIKLPHADIQVRHLSGGTQQKIILARWLAAHSRILIFDEATRGVDVNAKVEIYRLLTDLTRQGCAILMISSEIPELVSLCDRVLVMKDGRAVAELSGDAITADALKRVLY